MLESFETDWLIGICSVIFDIDEGQKVLDIYPTGAIGAAEASDVSFHAFPVLCLTQHGAAASIFCQSGSSSQVFVTQLARVAPQVTLRPRGRPEGLLSLQDSLSAELHSRTSVRDR